MIVTCPNCGARYRLSDEVVARGARLRCAACDHRWVPVGEAESVAEPVPEPVDPDDNAALGQVQAQMQAGEAEAGRWAARDGAARDAGEAAVPHVRPEAAAPPVAAETMAVPQAMAPEDDGEAPARSTLLRSILAVILGLALAIAATGLWAGQINVARLPVLGPALAGLIPAASPLQVTVAGAVTQLPSGGRVLEVTGTITNPGRRVQSVPLLKASLTGPTGNVRRWAISPPVTQLQPGESATFTSTVAGFPKDARTLSVTPGR
nr:zinc-ribbon domain-containing protein [Polymorphobacter sp.]